MKFEKQAEAKRTPFYVWSVMRPFLILTLMVGMAIAYMSYREERAMRAVYQAQSDGYARRIYDLYRETLDLRDRLDEMTKTAGAYRSYEVYGNCVMHTLGIYEMPDVRRALDRYWRSIEMGKRCLDESAWYETHPHGINPDHLNH